MPSDDAMKPPPQHDDQREATKGNAPPSADNEQDKPVGALGPADIPESDARKVAAKAPQQPTRVVRIWRRALVACGIQPLGGLVEPPQAKRTNESGSDNDESAEVLARRGPPGVLARFFQPRAALSRYERLEEWSLRFTSHEAKNIAWLLRARHAEAVLRAERAWNIGSRLALIASGMSLLGVAGALWGWLTVVSLVDRDQMGIHRVPDRLWIVLLATTTALVLLGGAAGLLFQVSGQFRDDSARYSRVADDARRLEAALRMALLSAPPTAERGPAPPDGAPANPHSGDRLKEILASLISQPTQGAEAHQTKADATPMSSDIMSAVATILKTAAEALTKLLPK